MNSVQYIKAAVQINSNAICWAQALLPLSPLQQAGLTGRIYSEGTGFRPCSLATEVSDCTALLP